MSKNYTVLKKENSYMNLGKNLVLECYRVNNDKNGNPMYKIIPINFNGIVKLDCVSRNMYTKNYWLIQSYNIIQDLSRIFSELEKHEFLNSIEPLHEDLTKDFKETKAFY